MADEIQKVNVEDLSGIIPAELTTGHRVILFTSDGDTNGGAFIDMVAAAVSNIGVGGTYTTTSNIPVGGSGVTIQVPTTYAGTVKSVSVWDGNVQIFPTVVRGNDGTYETVQLISGKAYTGAEVNITLK